MDFPASGLKNGQYISFYGREDEVFSTEARKTPASSFFSHKMKKCARGSFYALGHFSLLEIGAELRVGIEVISRRSRE